MVIAAVAHVDQYVGPNSGSNPHNEAYLMASPAQPGMGTGILVNQDAIFEAPQAGVYLFAIHVRSRGPGGIIYTGYSALHMAILAPNHTPPWTDIDVVQNYTDPANTQLVRIVKLVQGNRVGFRFGNAASFQVVVDGTVSIHSLS